MNTYDKLLLDDIQAAICILNKYLNAANLDVENRKSITHHLEISLDRLDAAIDIIKKSFK